ncbi:hypothetical protein HPB52_016996 [Rhipicephalus sanguineus]|uniref:Actin-related protein 8 n=1 Tax=Rhipicephalus sanguineus TaxID=34632 RepID=A0A9D4T0U3_RHISA|nr:hypothetical protein HPB52_016996 [Rhipicephalus sanguineus]
MSKLRGYKESYVKFGFVNIGGKPQCVLCGEVLALISMVPTKLKRHLRTKYPSYQDKDIEFFETKKQQLESQKLDNPNKLASSADAIKASYMLSYHGAKQMKPHTICETLLMPCMKDVVGAVIEKEHRRAARDVAEGSQASDATSQLDDSQLGQGALDEDEVVPPEAVTLAAAPRDSERELPCDQLLGIDQAIVQCVDRCDGEELKRKMFSCVLVVGGGCMFPGIHTWLQNRLSVQIPIMYRPEQMEIITRPRDTDPRITTWKGASIMSCLDSAQELWIRQAEWQRYGVRLLRERAPFNW